MGWFSSGKKFRCMKCKESFSTDDYTEVDKGKRVMLVATHDCGQQCYAFAGKSDD